ncbi:hypothetical protein D9M71_556450 [compost metagenome]
MGGAEEVNVEQAARRLRVCFLDSGEVTDTGVVDQYIHPAEYAFSFSHHGLGLFGIGYIQWQYQRLAEAGEILHLFGLACGDNHALALLEQMGCNVAAKTGGTAGYQPGVLCTHGRVLLQVVGFSA